MLSRSLNLFPTVGGGVGARWSLDGDLQLLRMRSLLRTWTDDILHWLREVGTQFPIKWSSRKGHWYLSVCACVRKCRLPFALRECLYVGAGGEKGYY